MSIVFSLFILLAVIYSFIYAVDVSWLQFRLLWTIALYRKIYPAVIECPAIYRDILLQTMDIIVK